MLKLLVPNKDEIERQKSCDCGQQEQQARSNSQLFKNKRELQFAAKQEKKKQLVDFYNKRLSQIKFTRDSVAEIKNQSEAGRELSMNISLLERRTDPAKIR